MKDRFKKPLEALTHCLEDGANEDALGWIGELFALTLAEVNKGLVQQGDGRVFTLEGGLKKYILSRQRANFNFLPTKTDT